MELSEIIPHIEALIFASEKPVTSLEITELINNAFGFMEDKITLDQVEAALDGVIEKYRSDFYPFEVRESGGGWQFLTKKEYHKTVAQLNGDKYLKRLSNAALETLSIIAYKQPITKGEIEAIRGVSADYSIQKLLEKELIVITGRNEELPGKPLVYATSKSFMDYFGLNSPDDLPKIKEVLAEQSVMPTVITEDELQPDTFPEAPEAAATGETEELNLVVLENGELEVLDPSGGPGVSGGVDEQAAETEADAETGISGEPVEERSKEAELEERDLSEKETRFEEDGPEDSSVEDDSEDDSSEDNSFDDDSSDGGYSEEDYSDESYSEEGWEEALDEEDDDLDGEDDDLDEGDDDLEEEEEAPDEGNDDPDGEDDPENGQ